MDTDRLSACSYPLREKDLDYSLKVISESGFDKVDLVGRMPHFSLTDPDYSVDELEGLCEKHRIRVANIGSYCGREFSSEDEKERDAAIDELSTTLDIAKRLGARTIRVVPGNGERRVIDSIVPYFKQAADTAEEYGIAMGIENHGTEITGNAKTCLEICEKVSSPNFGVLYDPSNLMAADADYKEAFEVFKVHVVHVHIKDGIYNDAGKWERTMLGAGQIDVRWIVEQMEALGYEGEYALEYEVEKIEPVETGYRKWWTFWRDL